MATIRARAMTLEEFLALPEEKPALEFAHGRIERKVPPVHVHAVLQAVLTTLINEYGWRARRALASTELRVVLGGCMRVPDISVYRWERIPRDSQGRIRGEPVTAPPDLIVEIVSPGQSVNGQIARCIDLLSAGVRVALLIDPDDESVVILRPDAAAQIVRGSERIALEDVLPGFELSAEAVFAALTDPDGPPRAPRSETS